MLLMIKFLMLDINDPKNNIKVKDKQVIYSVKSDVATFGNNEVIFNNDSIYKSFTENLDKKDTESFQIPIQSKITFNNIKHLGVSELNFYRQILNDSTTKKDILFKAHIDKLFYSKILLPISSLILILFFGSFIFTSLRDSSIGNRVVVSVVGAFIYQLIQDLSSDVFISYGLTVMFGVILPSLMLLVASMVSYKRI
jgi:lipopolysaccharide export LptBFGC system permease protein LptF